MAESEVQRFRWERELLGYPVSAFAEPLRLVADRLPEHVPLRRLPEMPGRTVTVAGVRLPGWTGGEGFYLWDGQAWVIVKANKSQKWPPPWEPALLRGRTLVDEWGIHWFQAEDVSSLSPGGRGLG